MTFEETLKDLPHNIIWALYREKLVAEGRYNAFVFLEECKGNAACIKERVEWYEAKLSDPKATARGQPYAPNTSVRLHADGHLAGLKDILKILTQPTNGSTHETAAQSTAQLPNEPHTAPSASAPAKVTEPIPDTAPTPDPA